MGWVVRYEPGGLMPRHDIEWAGRKRLSYWADYFNKWKPYVRENKKLRESDGWQRDIELASKILLEEIQPLTPLVRDLVKDIKDQENIQLRFNISSRDEEKDLLYVPFELIQHPDRADFMRQVSPVARRVLLEPQQMLRQIENESQADFNSVLYVLSDVEGVLSVRDCTFEKKETATFGRLMGLEEEWQAVEAAHTQAGRSCRKLELRPGDAIGALQAEMQFGCDIVHYSGHSIRADDGKDVFLVLPGRSDFGQLQPLRVRDFADLASKAGARMVILSSCESSSVEAIIRLAQYGIPTVIGFRWEVLDTGAKVFTSQLHKGLAAREPIGRAFFHALKDLTRGDANNNTPTFTSPVLIVQRDCWG